MPRAKRTGESKTADPRRYSELSNGNNITFVQYELDNSQKFELKAWRDEGKVTLSLCLAAFCEDGYKVSFKPDTRGPGCVVFISTDDKNSANFTGMLTGRGRTYESALMEAWYKHEYMKRRWNIQARGPQNSFWDD